MTIIADLQKAPLPTTREGSIPGRQGKKFVLAIYIPRTAVRLAQGLQGTHTPAHPHRQELVFGFRSLVAVVVKTRAHHEPQQYISKQKFMYSPTKEHRQRVYRPKFASQSQ